jgi:hypothetical protein
MRKHSAKGKSKEKRTPTQGTLDAKSQVMVENMGKKR